EKDLHALVETQGWDEDAVNDHVARARGGGGGGSKLLGTGGIKMDAPLLIIRAAAQQPIPDVEFGLYRFALKTGPFGSTAPPWRSVNVDAKTGFAVWPNNWDDSFPITKTSDAPTGKVPATAPPAPANPWPDAHFFFDRELAEVQPGSWVILEKGNDRSPFSVTDRHARSVS